MAISIDWGTKVINVPKADTQLVQASPTEVRSLNLDLFRLTLKDLEDDPDGISFPTTHNHVAPINVGGVALARVVEIINGYTITFEDGQYAVNLVGANSNVADVTNVNQVSVRSANSAGLTYSKEVEDQSFIAGRVWVDTINGLSGTQFPRGTPGDPVSNLTDAQSIIANRNLPKRLHLRGTITTSATDDLSDYDIEGDSAKLAAIQFADGCLTSNMIIRACDISGTLEGPITATDVSAFTALGDFEGKMIEGGLAEGTITLGDTDFDKKVEFVKCHSRVAGNSRPVIDASGVIGLELNIRGYHGGLAIQNFTDATMSASIDCDAAVIELDSSCTAGVIVVRGTGLLVDNSGPGCTVNKDGLVEGLCLQELHAIHGLKQGEDLTITDAARAAGSISQTISDDGTTTTVSRS